MADTSIDLLRASIKALKEVVAPAVDATNPLAVEQLRMVTTCLSLLAEQLPYRGERLRFDLLSRIGLAQALIAVLPVRPGSQDSEGGLHSANDAAQAIAQRPDATERDIVDATATLGAVLAAVVRGAAAANESVRRAIEQTVLAHSKSWLDVQRAWFLPMGFDHEKARLVSMPATLSNAIPTK